MSYCTVQEADEYVSTHYLSTDEIRGTWESLDEDSKQILLNRGEQVIDNLPLSGRKYDTAQPNAFPRNCSPDVPNEVKFAEVELALAYSDSDSLQIQDEYKRMVDYGISSYSIGNFSESILTYGKGSLQMKYGLISTQAERYLSAWLSGGFCVV